MHVLYNPDGVVKYFVIHPLRLINSAQYVDHIMPLCLSLIMHTALASGVDPVILEISSMLLNSEASWVSFLNQTLLQIEKYIKNGQPSFQCNV